MIRIGIGLTALFSSEEMPWLFSSTQKNAYFNFFKPLGIPMPGRTKSLVNLFLSYSHADCDTDQDSERSRLSEFLKTLKTELNVESPHSRYHWMRDTDGMLREGDPVDETIAVKIEEADIFLLALSRKYVSSSSTTAEFDQIHETGKPIFYFDLDCPQEKVTETPRQVEERWDERLSRVCEVIHAQLWKKPNGPSNPAVLMPVYKPGNELKENSEFTEKARAVARRIEKSGEEVLVSKQAGLDGAERQDLDGIYDVVLAESVSETSEVVDLFRTNLMRMAEKAGVSISVLNVNLADMDHDVLKEISESAHAYVQIFGNTPGRKVSDTPMTRWQVQNLAEVNPNPFFWTTDYVELDDLDEGYRDLLESLALESYPIEKFAKSVFKRVMANRSRVSREKTLAEQGLCARICVDAHLEDSKFSKIVCDEFSEQFDVTVIPPKDEAHQLALDSVENNDIQGVVLLHGPSEEGVMQAFKRFDSYRKRVALSQAGRLAIGKAKKNRGIPPPAGPDIQIITIGKDGIDPKEKEKFLELFSSV